MKRQRSFWSSVGGMALAGLTFWLSGCGGSSPANLPAPPSLTDRSGTSKNTDQTSGTGQSMARLVDERMKAEILRNVVRLLETAPTRPGGANIAIATDNLNQYFEGTSPDEFALNPSARAYLEAELADFPFEVRDFERPRFQVPDARHIEDCLLYQNIAGRVAGTGDALERVQRLFDWMVQHVTLVPEGSVIPNELRQQGLEHVPSRPYDSLLRGEATERPGGSWSERSWIFMVLCRQLGIDVGLVAYEVEDSDDPFVWACAALIDETPYLFDARIGMPIPGPDGTGVATLEDAITQPLVLQRLDLHMPGMERYPTHHDDLQQPLTIFIDSSRGYFAPRMRLLQNDLAGQNRMILYRDPAEQRDAFASALGDRLKAVKLWDLPLNVEYRLFTDPNFVRAAQIPNLLFDPELPMLGARLLQLRGDTADAIRQYVAFRFNERALLGEMEGAPPEAIEALKRALDSLNVHATYYLALCHLEQNHPEQAEVWFRNVLKMSPSARQGDLATLYGWGANTNLGLLAARRGDLDTATRHLGRTNPTPQGYGNLLRARDLVWQDPFGPAPPTRVEIPSEAEEDGDAEAVEATEAS